MKSIDWETPVEYENGYKSSPRPVDWTLVPMGAVMEVGKVITENCEEYGGKYERDNWRKSDWKHQYSAILNHLVRLEGCPEEEKLEHVSHVATRALMMLHLYLSEGL